MKQPGLADGVLAGGGVQHEQPLHRRRGIARDDPVELAQFLHQVDLRVQAPRGIDDQDVHPARPHRLQTVEDHGARVAARLVPHHLYPDPLRPDRQLIDRLGLRK